ncbi:MAG: ATP-binding protein [Sphingomonas sp.]
MMLDLIERTRVQALRAGDIIRRVRGFTIRGEISRAPTDIEAVLRAACASVREHPVGAGVTIECHFDVRARRAPVDALQLEQVVANLVRNAAEATQGSAVRRVAVATTLAADAILVRVTDSGRGLDDAMLHNLFEPFRTTKETGTGLGLPICRTIVEAHGGRLWAERAAGGGAQFCFTLPLAAAAAEEGYHGD